MTGPSPSFRDRFGSDPLWEVWVPGRANLIGDHIDYLGLDVLPVAVQFGVRVLAGPRATREVRLENSDPRFPSSSFPLDAPIDRLPGGHWSNYPRAAAARLGRTGDLAGLNALVDTDLPVAAGLSSSSALAVASAVALLLTTGRTPPPDAGGRAAVRGLPGALDLMTEMAVAEQFVGTMGGGMDQAVVIGGEAGCAMRISFDPLSLRPIPVPDGWAFVIAHSLVEAEKSGAAQVGYNRRRSTAELVFGRIAGGRAPMTVIGALRESGAVDDALSRMSSADSGLEEEALSSARHVLTEAVRVCDAADALERDDAEAFGRLMDASHHSLAHDLQVSHPRLDALIEVGRGAGALGARLTGAGFGGAAVFLTNVTHADDLVHALDLGFYRGQGVRFVVRPSEGAHIRTL